MNGDLTFLQADGSDRKIRKFSQGKSPAAYCCNYIKVPIFGIMFT